MISKRFSQSSCVDAFCIPLMNPVFELCLCHVLLCDVSDRTYGKVHKNSFISHTGDTPLLIQPHFFGGLSIGALPASKAGAFCGTGKELARSMLDSRLGWAGRFGWIHSFRFPKTAGEGQKKREREKTAEICLYLF